ncbi:OLC1v1031473C11 [Oldenlandia corymbosa var. corymbosa]|uniref:adenylate kinase n=1 Tax=Oldenlandia corymbosa var. corymbosa TaxID=529605 RepID=A0AAV1CJD5_OLDCO|nr:OLC1v1031473C11 [Oldenlandia corymbosa var. corymbosa]
MMGSSNKEAVDASLQIHKQIKVVFVMGGPGSGKGTQCSKIVQEFGYTHLSAGDLLRDEVKSGSENGAMIHDLMNEGKLVASDVIVRLIVKAIQETDNDKFLLDGFPRNEDNLKAFENLTKIEPDFVLYLDCPEEEMIKRVLSRNQVSSGLVHVLQFSVEVISLGQVNPIYLCHHRAEKMTILRP